MCTTSATDAHGGTFQRIYTPHGFAGVIQRYNRVADLLAPPALRNGRIGADVAYFMDGRTLFKAALTALRLDPYCFVEPDPARDA